MIVRYGSCSIALALLLLFAAAPNSAHAHVPLAGTTCDPTCTASETGDGPFSGQAGIGGVCGSIFNQTGTLDAYAGYDAQIDGAFYVANASAGLYGTNGVTASASIWDYSFGTGGSVSSSADCDGNETGTAGDGAYDDAVAGSGGFYLPN
jgi:hypothetical protein